MPRGGQSRHASDVVELHCPPARFREGGDGGASPTRNSAAVGNEASHACSARHLHGARAAASVSGAWTHMLSVMAAAVLEADTLPSLSFSKALRRRRRRRRHFVQQRFCRRREREGPHERVPAAIGMEIMLLGMCACAWILASACRRARLLVCAASSRVRSAQDPPEGGGGGPMRPSVAQRTA